jgi:thiamine pyrophosphokinase
MTFKTLQFVLPDVIVCLNGTLPDTAFFDKIRPVPIAAADGSAKKLRECSILPNYIVGDLDSLFDEIELWREQKGIIIHEVSDQNSTDYEKTLEFVAGQGCKNIMVCGIHGGELDHTLNNWSITIRYGKAHKLAVYDNGKIAVPIYESVQFATTQDDMISLIPQPHTHLTTEGLEWNLTNEVLELGKREGARNRATGTKVKLQVHSGSCLLFLKTALPYMPLVV